MEKNISFEHLPRVKNLSIVLWYEHYFVLRLACEFNVI